MSRIRFTAAKQIFDAFPAAAKDISPPPGETPPLEFLRRLLKSPRPIEAIAYCAYLLPRREAVWWAAQCVRALQDRAAPDAALLAAEAWVRDPEEKTRRVALDLGAHLPQSAATTWLACAAGWSGGDIGQRGGVSTSPHLTAKALRAAITLALAETGARDQSPLIAALIEAGIRFAEGGSATPTLPPAQKPRRVPQPLS